MGMNCNFHREKTKTNKSFSFHLLERNHGIEVKIKEVKNDI
jgi:hypothetical protein